MIRQMLAQGIQQPGTQGGMQGAMSPGNAAAQLASKALLMRALQTAQNTQQANAMLPGTNRQIANDPQMRGLQQTAMPPLLQPLAVADTPAPIAPQ
jgi:hypothetical protein